MFNYEKENEKNKIKYNKIFDLSCLTRYKYSRDFLLQLYSSLFILLLPYNNILDGYNERRIIKLI